METFLAQTPGSPENVGIAYYNTVTGEYHEYHGDQYFHAASLYKLPLNMYYSEKVFLGEMTLDDKIAGQRYGDMQRASLQFSSNPESESLMGNLGNGYLDAIRPYLAEENEDYDRRQLLKNCFTPRQMIHELSLLYSQPEHYPDMLYYLQKANQDNFFCKYEQRFSIAHKYGWLSEEGFTVVNDVGIVWTEEPILIVFMSNNNSADTVTIGQFCVLMCDYCQYWHSFPLEAEEVISGEDDRRQINEIEIAKQAQDEITEPDVGEFDTTEDLLEKLQNDGILPGVETHQVIITVRWLLLVPILFACYIFLIHKFKK